MTVRVPGLTWRSGPSIGATSVIAAGVGLAAMVFGLADPVLRSLPYADPDRLVAISFGLPAPGLRVTPADVPSLATWQARADLFVGLAAFEDRGWMRVRASDRIVPLRAVAATDNLLEVLGLPTPPVESDPAAALVFSRVANSYFADAFQPGRSVSIVPEGVMRVSGILPDTFLLPQANRIEPVDAITVLPAGPVIRIEGVSSDDLNIVARLRPEVTPQMVEAALNVSMAPVGRRVTVRSLSTTLNARLRGLAKGALLASGLLVFVAWTNVFSLAMTRGLYRQAEMVTRSALGATPGRIVRLLGGEALRVAAPGGGAALAIAWLALTAAVPALPAQFATLGAPAVTSRVVVFVVVAAAIAGGSWYAASLLAWSVSRQRQPLHITSRDGRSIRIVRFVVIAGQLGAASVLLVGSALLGRSYLNLMSVDSGLDDRLQTLIVAHDPGSPPAMRRDVVERTLVALRRSGGLVAAGASAGALLDGRANVGTAMIDGRVVLLDRTAVAGDYFAAMNLAFLAGAPPEPGQEGVGVINESAAREFFDVTAPIGATLSITGTGDPGFRPVRIVGVVRDVRARALAAAPRPGIYLQAGGWNGGQPETTYVLRRRGEQSGPLLSFEQAVRQVDPLAIVLNAGSIGGRLDRSVRDRTFATLVIGSFAVASAIVAVLGLAGVVAHTVVKRTREIAIRLALGATADRVTTLVVREAMIAATCGLAAGVIASVWLSHALDSLLYGVAAADPTTLLLTAASLLLAVLMAAILPGIRAGRIAPASALRME